MKEVLREAGEVDPWLVYDPEHDLCRLREDGRFALFFSGERADRRGLKGIGYFSAWGM